MIRLIPVALLTACVQVEPRMLLRLDALHADAADTCWDDGVEPLKVPKVSDAEDCRLVPGSSRLRITAEYSGIQADSPLVVTEPEGTLLRDGATWDGVDLVWQKVPNGDVPRFVADLNLPWADASTVGVSVTSQALMATASHALERPTVDVSLTATSALIPSQGKVVVSVALDPPPTSDATVSLQSLVDGIAIGDPVPATLTAGVGSKAIEVPARVGSWTVTGSYQGLLLGESAAVTLRPSEGAAIALPEPLPALWDRPECRSLDVTVTPQFQPDDGTWSLTTAAPFSFDGLLTLGVPIEGGSGVATLTWDPTTPTATGTITASEGTFPETVRGFRLPSVPAVDAGLFAPAGGVKVGETGAAAATITGWVTPPEGAQGVGPTTDLRLNVSAVSDGGEVACGTTELPAALLCNQGVLDSSPRGGCRATQSAPVVSGDGVTLTLATGVCFSGSLVVELWGPELEGSEDACVGHRPLGALTLLGSVAVPYVSAPEPKK